MLKRLSFVDFMGAALNTEDYVFFHDKSKRYEPTRFIQVTGGIGAGKTRLVEAACFALTGFDTKGEPNPSHLISEGESEAIVTIKFGPYTILRLLSRVARKSSVAMRQKGAPIAYSDEGITAALGMSPHTRASACIAGYFGRLSSVRKRNVYNEVFDRKIPVFSSKFKVQEQFRHRIINSQGQTYTEMSAQDRTMFDLQFCYEIHRHTLSRLGFIFFDDADTFIWNDEATPPRGVQLIFSKFVPCAPFEVRGGF